MMVSRCLRTQKYCKFKENEGVQVQKSLRTREKEGAPAKIRLHLRIWLGVSLCFSDFSILHSLRESAANCELNICRYRERTRKGVLMV